MTFITQHRRALIAKHAAKSMTVLEYACLVGIVAICLAMVNAPEPQKRYDGYEPTWELRE